jgi:hypothetical protein
LSPRQLQRSGDLCSGGVRSRAAPEVADAQKGNVPLIVGLKIEALGSPTFGVVDRGTSWIDPSHDPRHCLGESKVVARLHDDFGCKLARAKKPNREDAKVVVARFGLDCASKLSWGRIREGLIRGLARPDSSCRREKR